MHDYDQIAAIVGEDKINALREAGVNIADKPTKPTTGLLGRWAKDKDGSPVLISSDYVRADGNVWITFLTGRDRFDGGADTASCSLSSLTFPEETTRPEDVPVGEAWLVNVDDRVDRAESVPAVKTHNGNWATGAINDETWWIDKDVILITPLIPARPADTDREHTLETVTTEDEYAALPVGSIVAEQDGSAYLKGGITWLYGDTPFSYRIMPGTTRTVLRKGWGE